jgi:serine/threonine protein kinase
MPRDSERDTSATPPDGQALWLGRYRVSETIGAGGMGEVSRAFDTLLGRPVAIKFIRGPYRLNEEMRRRFAEEAGKLALLNHPAIVQVFDYGTRPPPGDDPFIVMEYVPGARPITAFCRDSGHGLDEILDLFIALFDGLAQLHARGFIHRDIKPANILVDGEGRPKLIDFGLALARGSIEGMLALEIEGSKAVGTVAYMSPEQRRGDPVTLDHRTDLFSLALVMFEVLAGRPPLIVDELPEFDALPKEVPEDLRAALRGALQPRRSDRTASALEVRDALRRVREQRVAERVRPGRSAERPALRLARWGLAALAGLLGAAGIYPLVMLATPLGGIYARWATAILTDADGDFQKVRVVSITERTLEQIAGDGPPRSIFDARATHPALTDRLVAGGAGVIVWDLVFATEVPDHDPAFAESIRRAADAGVPVALMVRLWSPELQWGRVAPGLAASPAVVAPGTGSFGAEAPWTIDLLARRGEGFLEPALALAAVAAAWQPGARVDYELDEPGRVIAVRHWQPDEGGRRRQVGRTIRVPYSAHRVFNESGVSVAMTRGDFVAQTVVRVRSDRALLSSTIAYEDVLRMNADELLAAFAGRAVVIGRTDEAGNDIKPHPGGRRVAGCYAHAEAIESLLLSRRIIVWSDALMQAGCAAGGVVGFLSLFRGSRSPGRWVTLGAVTLLAGAMCLSALSVRTIVYPAPVVVSVIIGGILAAIAWAVLTRGLTPGRVGVGAAGEPDR